MFRFSRAPPSLSSSPPPGHHQPLPYAAGARRALCAGLGLPRTAHRAQGGGGRSGNGGKKQTGDGLMVIEGAWGRVSRDVFTIADECQGPPIDCPRRDRGRNGLLVGGFHVKSAAVVTPLLKLSSNPGPHGIDSPRPPLSPFIIVAAAGPAGPVPLCARRPHAAGAAPRGARLCAQDRGRAKVGRGCVATEGPQTCLPCLDASLPACLRGPPSLLQ